MHSSRGSVRRGKALSVIAVLPLALPLALLLAGCTKADTAQVSPASVVVPVPIYADVTVTPDVPYRAGDGATQLLDICEPTDVTASTINNGPLRALVLVHGGSWREGDKASTWWRSTCEWLASEGFIVFNLNYRLAPEHPFPEAIDDLKAAVTWLRAPEQVGRFAYDPALIGALGGSAGGNLVSLLGTSGEGSHAAGSRVAAVVELSAPTDLTRDGLALGVMPDGFDRVQLDYLGCADYNNCRAAVEASPQSHIDASDPPFFIGHALEEFIPVEHARSLSVALKDAGIPVVLSETSGTAHSIALLGTAEPTAMRGEIVEFLRAHLG